MREKIILINEQKLAERKLNPIQIFFIQGNNYKNFKIDYIINLEIHSYVQISILT